MITEDQIKSMKPGSVIIDLAADSGGNCEFSKPEQTIKINNVSIVGASNITSKVSQDASSLYAKNLLNFIKLLVNEENNKLDIDWEDEIISNTIITKDGKIVNKEFN